MGINENLCPLVNIMTIANDILFSQGVTFATIAVNELFDALVVDQIFRFEAEDKSQDTKGLCRLHMTTSHTIDKCANFKRFVKGIVVKGVISLNEK